jgi:mono/diheme cytochrome c family protein
MKSKLLLFLVAACGALTSTASHAEGTDKSLDLGRKVYVSANCVGCHKWTGMGGGGYGGAAANLRTSQLNKELLILTVQCGRPATGMPYFQRDAYKDGHCYGMTEEKMPPDAKVIAANAFLQPRDVELVVNYVMHAIQGQGSPTFEQCTAFYGSHTRACDVYKEPPAGSDRSSTDKSTK